MTWVRVKPHFSCQNLTLTFNLPLVFPLIFFLPFAANLLTTHRLSVPGTTSFPGLGSHKSGSYSLMSLQERAGAKVISELC